jgi:hypothetical protein
VIDAATGIFHIMFPKLISQPVTLAIYQLADILQCVSLEKIYWVWHLEFLLLGVINSV